MIGTRTLMGDSKESLKGLPDNYAHVCITSPPYWGLRSYLPKGHPLKHLEIGMEKTPEAYVEKLVWVFREVRRVLREDGTLWLNLGDTMFQGTKGNSGALHDGCKQSTNGGSLAPRRGEELSPSRSQNLPGLKPKDLIGLPWLVALALRADGWYLRCQIPWIKRNPMPESAEDRPSIAVEYIWLLSKCKTYYYDRYAVMMPSSDNTHPRVGRDGSMKGNRVTDQMRLEARGGRGPACNPKAAVSDKGTKQNASFAAACSLYLVGERNRRNADWFMESWQGLLTDDQGDPLAFIVNPMGSRIAHYASYPEKLVEPMVKASTSEHGCCPNCGAGWERIVEVTQGTDGREQLGERHGVGFALSMLSHRGKAPNGMLNGYKTLGWQPGCDCPRDFRLDPQPAIVLDPFAGTHTTSAVANRLGRQAIDCELNPDYHAAAAHRTAQGGLL
jgi:DNA modification methylase